MATLFDNQVEGSGQEARPSYVPDRGGSEGGEIVLVRGRPVRIAPDCSLHAVEPGYFPCSSTGYRSCCDIETTPDALEKLAQENDKGRADALRRAQKALRWKGYEGGQADETSLLIKLVMDMQWAVGFAWLAPEQDRRALLAAALELARRISGLPVGEGKQGAWCPEDRRREIEHIASMVPYLQEAVREGGDMLGLAEATAASQNPNFHPPSILREAWGITRAGFQRPETKSEAADLGLEPGLDFNDLVEAFMEDAQPAEVLPQPAAPVFREDKRGQMSMF